MKNTMKFLKFIFKILAVILILTGGCIFYAFKIEPYRLTVKEYHLTENGAGTVPVKIVQFSDLHIKEDFTSENLKKVVSCINRQNPDIVIFTGDLYDNYAKYRDDENIIGELKKIEANYGKIAIWGNRDYGGGAVRRYSAIMEQAGFTLLKNEDWHVTAGDGRKITVTGLDDSILGNASMPDSAQQADSDYRILLSHEPDAAEAFRPYRYNLILSGHSHGGQVNIPFLPAVNETALSATNFTRKYAGGMYHLAPDETLYVNTGIGTTHISARFGVVPQISVFYLYLP